MDQIAIGVIKTLLKYDMSKIDPENRKFFQDQFSQKDPSIPYDAIADYVYQHENSIESNEQLNKNIEYLCSKFKGSIDKKTNLENNLRVISVNYSLYQAQKSYISKVAQGVKQDVENLSVEVGQANSILESVSTQAEQANSTLESVQESVEKIDQTKSSIYTDFISILGVFSAFVFVMFGGIEIARAVFDIGDDLLNMDLSKMITISCLMLIGVITLMYSLLLWISRITKKDIGKCMCSECKNGCLHKWKHFYLRHSFYFSLVILLVVICIVSIKSRP